MYCSVKESEVVMKKLISTLFVAVLFATCVSGIGAGATITVGPGAGHNYSSIQAAIDNAANGDEIVVAPGTYNEAINFLTRAVHVYSTGGPASTTINGAGYSHVVQFILGEGAGSILEGFTIKGGNASGISGGGIRIVNSSPTIINCIVTQNSARSGGGVSVENGSPTLTDCTLTTNSCTDVGGGIFVSGGSPTLTRCIVTGNTAANHGAGVYNHYSSSTITDCTITGNTASVDGGGMYNNGGTSTVTHCIFSSNNAIYGGAMYNTFGAAPLVINCIFRNNVATVGGGGLLNQTNAVPTLMQCTFYGNTASSGGAMSNYGYGGASTATVINCILWANTGGPIHNTGGTAVVTYSNVQGGYPGTGNIDANPLFVDAPGGDFRLICSGSPCVDTGDNSAPNLPATDVAGNPRVVDGNFDETPTVDMGAYELSPRQIYNIARETWYEAIQFAIKDSAGGDEIQVGPATYHEAINFSGKAIRLFSSDGPDTTTIDGTGNYHVVQCVSGEGPDTILEGFTITGGNANGPTDADKNGSGMYNINSSPTVIDCLFTGNIAVFSGGGMFNHTANPTVIDCTFEENTSFDRGGGMYNASSSPTVQNCRFVDNTSTTMYGGGMYNLASNSNITHCTFIGNAAVWGGGMYNTTNSLPRVEHCVFLENTATDHGGGMKNFSTSHAIVTNCTFIGNAAANYGGGMFNDNSRPVVTNCVYSGNTSAQGGGMANYGGSNAVITHCTFSGNSAGGGAGIRSWNSSPTVRNCILWGNEPDQISREGTGTLVVAYSNVQGGYTGTGNINVDPLFVDAGEDDFRLLPGSPCIDAADTTAVPAGIFLDGDGHPRAVNDPATPNTGITVLGMTVDMGAYEFEPWPAGDINRDSVVDLHDFMIVAENWLEGVQ